MGNLIDIALIAFLSIVPVRSTLNNGNLIVVQDFGFPLRITPPSFYGWNHKTLTGLNSMLLSFNWLPYHSILFFLNSLLNVPLWILNRLVIVASFFFLGFGVYFLLRVCGRSRYASLTASFFAMFNPTVATRDSYGQMPLLIQLGFIPIVLGLYIWSKNRGLSNLDIALLTSLASLPIMVLANPVEIGFLAFCFIMLMLTEVIYDKKEILNNLKILILYLVISFLINSWWLLPGLYYMIYSRGQFYTAHEYATRVIVGISGMSSVVKAFQLHTLDTVGRFDFYGETRIKLLGLLLLSFSLFFSILKRDRLNSFSLMVFVPAVALFQGISPPLGGFYRFLYDNMPGFFIYREVNHFDSLLLLSTSLLLGSSIDSLAKRMSARVSRFLLLLLLLLLVFTYGSPVLSGNLEGFFTPLDIPEYYFDALSYLEKVNTSARIFYSAPYIVIYGWHPPHCVTEDVFYLDPFMPPMVNSYIAFSATSLPDHARALISDLLDLDKLNIDSLRFLGVKYVVMDSAEGYSKLPLKGVKLEKEFGSVRIYKVEDPLPIIYFSNSLVTTDRLDVRSVVDQHKLFVLKDQSQFPGNITFSSEVRLNWTYISPVEYKVRVNSTGPFFLVFTDTYDDGWSASSANKTYAHFVGNGYSNAWLVDDSGSFEMRIEFRPNALFYYGSVISLLSILLFSLYLFRAKIRKNFKREGD